MRLSDESLAQTVLSVRQYCEHAVAVQNVDMLTPRSFVVRLPNAQAVSLLRRDVGRSGRMLGNQVPTLVPMRLEDQRAYFEGVLKANHQKSKSTGYT